MREHDGEQEGRIKRVFVVPDDAPVELDAIAGRAEVEVVRTSGKLRSVDRSLTNAGVVGASPPLDQAAANSPRLRPAG
jgi:hypothetical protein